MIDGAPRTVVLALGAAERIRSELEQIPGITVVERYAVSSAHDGETIISGLDGAWGVVAGSERYSRDVLGALPALKAILRWGTGSDAIDIPAATDAGVAVVTTPAVNAEAVADMALALMLACIRRLPELDAIVRSGDWRALGPTRDLACSTVGIVGLGAIGRAVTRRVRGFGCRVLAVEPNADLGFCDEYEVELTSLDEMLPQVDVLTLHAPATDSTRGLIGARELALLSPRAVLVNTARGELIDQAALVRALRHEQIAAAGLDVFEHEPPPRDDPILSAPNTVVSGHLSSYTDLGLERTGEMVIANLHELLTGKLPASCLNPEAWSATR
ncbi:MAG TPA: NAD(P)-dependent oxidoreductase [Solirubrobacteraceae bacterium]|nr:NAD(P)-dependent oxidoreductase [Solirubrobacteraceae bacterium]